MLLRLQNRLFVPLTKQAFEWFKNGKQWEVRKFKVGQYNLRNIVIGREVELRLGYRRGKSIWGVVSEVKIFENVEQLIDDISYELITPSADTKEQAKEFIEKYVGLRNQIIAFRINCNK